MCSTQPSIGETLCGIVSLIECMERRRYIIPQYPVYCVDLLHVKIRDKGGALSDAFVESKTISYPVLLLEMFLFMLGFFFKGQETC